MVQQWVREARGTEAAPLYDLILRDQLLNIRWLVPAFLCFFLAGAILTSTWPDFFLRQRGHIAIAAFQFIALAGYLVYLLRSFAGIAPLILIAQAVWQSQATTKAGGQESGARSGNAGS